MNRNLRAFLQLAERLLTETFLPARNVLPPSAIVNPFTVFLAAALDEHPYFDNLPFFTSDLHRLRFGVGA